MATPPHPVTPDGRYMVVRGRLWRRANPALGAPERQRLVAALMAARRALRRSAASSPAERTRARAAVHAAKLGLGERGPVWWQDGSPAYDRHLVGSTPYRDWYAELTAAAAPATPGAEG